MRSVKDLRSSPVSSLMTFYILQPDASHRSPPRTSEFFKDVYRAKKTGDFYQEKPAGRSPLNPGQ
jgi:hypothetical protein